MKKRRMEKRKTNLAEKRCKSEDGWERLEKEKNRGRCESKGKERA